MFRVEVDWMLCFALCCDCFHIRLFGLPVIPLCFVVTFIRNDPKFSDRQV